VADNYILAIGPHPDDVEAGCGGSVARFIDEGNKLIYLVFSKCLDQKGNEGIVEEVQNSSRALSVDKFLLYDLPNRRLFERGEEMREILEEIRERYNPRIVFCPSDDDIHQDHRAVYKETYRVFRNNTVLGYEIPRSSVQFNPELYIKLRPVDVKKKLAALSCFQTQRRRAYFKKTVFVSTLIHRGAFIGEKYAEAYRALRVVW
jgi:LmbE family N-acetylglucosaminyl deacetylase